MVIGNTYCSRLDRAGRFSALRAATPALAIRPAAWLATEAREGRLAPEPWTKALHRSGAWAVRFLLLSLAVTPLRRVWQRGQLIAMRRMLGLTALAYAALHLTLYVGQQHGDLVHGVGEIASRFYLAIGFTALLGLAVLGATSTDGTIRRTGGKRWLAPQGSASAIALPGLLHFTLQSRLDISQPVLVTGLFLLPMGWRLLPSRELGDRVPAPLGLAVRGAVASQWVRTVHVQSWRLPAGASRLGRSPNPAAR